MPRPTLVRARARRRTFFAAAAALTLEPAPQPPEAEETTVPTAWHAEATGAGEGPSSRGTEAIVADVLVAG